MDRKKFIKACMGAGIQRDIAAQLAATDVHPWLVSAPLRDWQRRGTA